MSDDDQASFIVFGSIAGLFFNIVKSLPRKQKWNFSNSRSLDYAE